MKNGAYVFVYVDNVATSLHAVEQFRRQAETLLGLQTTESSHDRPISRTQTGGLPRICE